MRPFRRSRVDTPRTNEAIEQSQVVAQLMFADEQDGIVTIDVVALTVRHPSGRSGPGSGFELRLQVPRDPTWGSMFSQLLSRWADENRVIGMDFGAGQPPVVTLKSVDCTMRLDVVTDALY